jgi:hypothetical protein
VCHCASFKAEGPGQGVLIRNASETRALSGIAGTLIGVATSMPEQGFEPPLARIAMRTLV